MAPPLSCTSFAERDADTARLFAELDAAGCDEERERLIEQITGLYLGLCTTMASRYSGRGIEFDDLVQVARLALVKSINRYEPGHGPSFAAYAVPTISGELKRWFRDRGWVVRPPRRLQELRASVQAARATLEQEFGAEPSEADIADHLGLTVEQVREAATASTGFRALSLDCPATEEHRPGLELFLARPDEDLDSADDRVCLTEVLTTLGDDERELLAMRFVEGLTQREIGEIRGVSQMQVSRTLRRIIGRLRDGLLDETQDGAAVG
jgi:RNA polymerase sigma-B factor